MKDNILGVRAEAFALRVIELSRFLSCTKNEYIISKQIVRSGTSIGANIAESEFAQSKADFVSKLYISLKEANETRYWLRLLRKSQYMSSEEIIPMESECSELISMLVSSLKTLKRA